MPKRTGSPCARIALVCMPWASISQPSLALGLLKAQLAEAARLESLRLRAEINAAITGA